jgi:hypothetical protein
MKQVGVIKQKLIGKLIHFYKDVAHEEDDHHGKRRENQKKSHNSFRFNKPFRDKLFMRRKYGGNKITR